MSGDPAPERSYRRSQETLSRGTPRVEASGDAGDPLEAFAAWSRRYWASPAALRPALVAEGVRLARARREVMRRLIRESPERALDAALGFVERRDLPAEVTRWLETPVAGRGDFEVVATCYLEDGSPGRVEGRRGPAHRHDIQRFAVLADERYEAFVYGRRRAVTTKFGLSLRGVALDGELALDEEPLRLLGEEESAARGLPADGSVAAEVMGEIRTFPSPADAGRLRAALVAEEEQLGPETGPAHTAALPGGGGEGEAEAGGGDGDGNGGGAPAAAASPWTEGDKTLLYIRVRFADEAPSAEPVSLRNAELYQDDCDEFFRRNSYGKTSLTSVITDVVELPQDLSYYAERSLNTLLSAGRAAAEAAGLAAGENWDAERYDLYAVASRGGVGSYSGIAFVGSRGCHLQNFQLRTAGHEFGHNLGLHHANYNYTSDESPRGTSPRNGDDAWVEYGHRFSLMSAQSSSDMNDPVRPHFSVREKAHLGWLGSAAVERLESSAQSGRYRLYQHDHADATGLRALQVPAADPARPWYWLGFRTAFNNTFLDHGLEVNWARTSYNDDGSILLDMTPYSRDGSHSGSSWTRDNNDKVDAALRIGRTYSDGDVHVTPVARGGVAPDEYLDVVVNLNGGENTLVLISEDSPCRAVVPASANNPGPGWTAPGFDHGAWPIEGTLGVGYERGNGYGLLIGTDVEGELYNRGGSLFIRVPFEVGGEDVLASIAGLELQIRYDDGFIAYLNGVQVASRNAPPDAAWNARATQDNPDSRARVREVIDLDDQAVLLRPGANVLALHGLNGTINSSDLLLLPELVAEVRAGGTPLEVALLPGDRGANPGEVVPLTTAVSGDGAGGELAYCWDFDQGQSIDLESLNQPAAAMSWNSPGQYTVRVIVSDLKGREASDTAVITVGDPSAAGEVRGRVLRGGRPVQGARVFSGGGRQTYSDTDGNYVLSGLASGDHTLSAQADGLTLTGQFPNPVPVGGTAYGQDFWAAGPLPVTAGVPRALTVSPYAVALAPGGSVTFAATAWDNTGAGDEVLLPRGSTWRYLDDGPDPGGDWFLPSFDDGGWAAGPAVLGYGEGAEATVIGFGGDELNKVVRALFRTTFHVAEPTAARSLSLQLLRDDGAVVYLNGVEVARSNLPPGTPGPGTVASGASSGADESTYFNFPLDPAGLVAGENLLAVAVHQSSPVSSDLAFDAAVVASGAVGPAAATWAVNGGGTVDADGRFVSDGTPGVFTLTADDGLITGTATVVVGDGVTPPFVAWMGTFSASIGEEERAMGADPDGDGWSNLLEYALGGDPSEPSQRAPGGAVQLAPVRVGGGGDLTFRFRQLNPVQGETALGIPGIDYTVRGLRYRAEVSPDLLAWSSGPEQFEPAGPPVDNGDGTSDVTVRPRGTLAPGQIRYVRLRVDPAE